MEKGLSLLCDAQVAVTDTAQELFPEEQVATSVNTHEEEEDEETEQQEDTVHQHDTEQRSRYITPIGAR